MEEGRASAEPFGLPTEKVLYGPILSRWLELEERLREETDTLVNCDEDMSSCSRAAKLFRGLISEASADRGLRRIANWSSPPGQIASASMNWQAR